MEDQLPEGFTFEDELPEGFVFDETPVTPVENVVRQTPTWNAEDIVRQNTDNLMTGDPEKDAGIQREVDRQFNNPNILQKVSRDVVGGMMNAPKNLASTAVAFKDWLTGHETGQAEAIQKAYPTYEAPKEREGFISDTSTAAGEMLVGGGAALKGLGTLGKVFKNPEIVSNVLAKAATNMTKVLTAEAGAIASSAPETDAFLSGYLGTAPDGTFSEELIERRSRALLEAMLFTKVGELGVRGVAWTAEMGNELILQPLLQVTSLNALEKVLGKQVADKIAQIMPGDTQEQYVKKLEGIRDALTNNSEERFMINENGLNTEVQVPRDSMEAIDLGLGDENPAITTRARNMRRGVEAGGNTDLLETARGEANRQTDKLFTGMKQAAGGDEAITRTTQSIQGAQRKPSLDLMNDVSNTRQRLFETKEGIQKVVAEDPSLGQVIDNLSEDIQLPSGKRVSEMTADELSETIQEASDEMTKTKNDLYNAIPESALVRDKILKDQRALVDDLLPEELKTKFDEAGRSFKKLNQLVNFSDFSDTINQFKKAGKFEEVDRLLAFKEAITDDELSQLVKQGSKGVKEAVEKAQDYYVNKYAPYWRNNPTLRNIQRRSRDFKYSPDEKSVYTRDELTKQLDNPDTEFINRIGEFLKTEEGGKSATKLADYAIAKVSEEAQRLSRAGKGKLTPEQIVGLTDTLEKYHKVFNAVDPSQNKRFSKFLTTIRNMDLNEKELQDLLKSQTKDLGKLETDLMRSPFFNDLKPRGNTTAIYKDVFDDPDVVDKLPQLIKEAGDNSEGLKAAFSDRVRKSLLKGDSRSPQTAPIKEEEFDKLMEAGKLLYGKDSKIIEATKAIKTTLQRRLDAGKAEAIHNLSDYRKNIGGVIDFAVTQTLGVLNTVGARVRSGLGKAADRYDPKDAAKEILDKIYSDPEHFAKVLDQIIKKEKGKIDVMSPSDKKLIQKWIAGSVMYGQQDRDTGEDLDRQTEEVFKK